MGAHLSGDEILDSLDLEFHDETVPEWKKKSGEPGVVRLVQLPASEEMEMNDLMTKPGNRDDGMFIILIFCAHDPESGDRLFPFDGDTAAERAEKIMVHVVKLRKKSMRVLNRLQRIALRLNAMDKPSEVALKKDSSGMAIGGSPTALH